MQVTVIVCTRNGSARIGPTLTACRREVNAWGSSAELLVVDSASSTLEAEALAELCQEHDARLLTLSRPGLSRARNAAASDALGDVLAFTDDDAVPDPGWLEHLVRPILSGAANATSGAVRLTAQSSAHGLPDFFLLRLAIVSGADPENVPMIGVNMALTRRDALALSWDEELGAGARGFAEDTLLGLQLRELGTQIGFCSGAVVEHSPDESRLTPGGWRDHARRHGTSDAWVWHHWLHTDLSLLSARALVKVAYALGAQVVRAPLEVQMNLLYEVQLLRGIKTLRKTPRLYYRRGVRRLPNVSLNGPAPKGLS